MEEAINTLNPVSDLPEANVVRRNAAGIIDAALVILLFTGIILYFSQSILNRLQSPIRIEFYILLLLVFYRLISLVFFHQTIGIRLCNIQLLNEYDDRLSIKEKIFAAFFILINGIAYYKLEHK